MNPSTLKKIIFWLHSIKTCKTFFAILRKWATTQNNNRLLREDQSGKQRRTKGNC